MEGVEQHLEVVLLLFVEILLQLVDHDARRIRVVQVRTDVDALVVEQHAHFRALRRGLPSVWLALDEP